MRGECFSKAEVFGRAGVFLCSQCEKWFFSEPIFRNPELRSDSQWVAHQGKTKLLFKTAFLLKWLTWKRETLIV